MKSTARTRLLRLTATAAALAFMPSIAANAIDNFRITGVVVDSAGQPLPGAFVGSRDSASASITDANGAFSVTVIAGTTQLVLADRNLTARDQEGNGILTLFSEPVTFTEDTSIGQVTLPDMRPIGVKVVDVDGDDVAFATWNNPDGVNQAGANWSRAANRLSPQMAVAAESFTLRTTTGESGFTQFRVPVQPGDTLPPALLTHRSENGSVFVASLDEAQETAPGQYSLTVDGLDIPGRPQITSVVRGDRSLTVTWTAPVGNDSVDSYRATALRAREDSGPSCQTTSALTCRISNLANGVPHTIRVFAFNGDGSGAPARSAPIAPATLPSPVRTLQHRVRGRLVTLTWGAPISDGGSPITRYRVVLDRTTVKNVTAPLRRIALRFKPGKHSAKVIAVNDVGSSAQNPAVTFRVR